MTTLQKQGGHNYYSVYNCCSGILLCQNYASISSQNSACQHGSEGGRRGAAARRKSFMLHGFQRLVPGVADVFTHKLLGTGGLAAGNSVDNALVLCEN